MEYIKRLDAPSTTDKHWIHTSKGGLNSCILIKGDSVLPNCVGYAWGRAYELLGEKPKLSRADAEKWYTYSDGYKRGQEPKLGAIICWKNDFGHVAVVEEIKEDGTIVTSESAYSGTRFRTMNYKPPYVLASKYDFQGFIYIGEWEEEKEEIPFADKTDEELAAMVWSGELGNNPERKEALGVRYDAVQELVNQGIGKPEEPKPEPKEIKEGDTVTVNGYGTASSTGSGATTRVFENTEMKVIAISGNDNRPNQYGLNQYNRGNVGDYSAVTAWFNKESLK